jgi:hypothetical protein
MWVARATGLFDSVKAEPGDVVKTTHSLALDRPAPRASAAAERSQIGRTNPIRLALCPVMRGQKRGADARERAYFPRIPLLNRDGRDEPGRARP